MLSKRQVSESERVDGVDVWVGVGSGVPVELQRRVGVRHVITWRRRQYR